MNKRIYFNEHKLREAHVDPFHPVLQVHVFGLEQFPWIQGWLQIGSWHKLPLYPVVQLHVLGWMHVPCWHTGEQIANNIE